MSSGQQVWKSVVIPFVLSVSILLMSIFITICLAQVYI